MIYAFLLTVIKIDNSAELPLCRELHVIDQTIPSAETYGDLTISHSLLLVLTFNGILETTARVSISVPVLVVFNFNHITNLERTIGSKSSVE